MKDSLDRFFGIYINGSTFKTEILAGVTTFCAVFHIMITNPAILEKAGMSRGAVFVATCLVAAIGSFIMGLYVNLPIISAPAMGLNVYFALTVVQTMGYRWQVALGAVFLSGCLCVVICLCRLREILINAFPEVLRIGITAGIGLFLMIIAIESTGLSVADPKKIMTIGSDVCTSFLIFGAIGLLTLILLEYWQIRGAILCSMLIVMTLSFFFEKNIWKGIVSMPPTLRPVFLKLQLPQVFSVRMLQLIYSLCLIQIFDATGTMMLILNKINLVELRNKKYLFNKALLADSILIPIGALFGVSSTTAYVESTLGIEVGGRTGLTAIVSGLLFLIALFFFPLTQMIPSYAAAPALFYIGCLMLKEILQIHWKKITDIIPVIVIVLIIAISQSISDGLGFGLIVYTSLKLITRQYHELNHITWFMTILFISKFFILYV